MQPATPSCGRLSVDDADADADSTSCTGAALGRAIATGGGAIGGAATGAPPPSCCAAPLPLAVVAEAAARAVKTAPSRGGCGTGGISGIRGKEGWDAVNR